MAFRSLFEIGTFNLLVLVLIFISPRVLRLFLVLERIQTSGVVTSPFDIVTLSSWLALRLVRRGHQLICEVRLVRICTRMIFFTQEHRCILIVFDALLRLLMEFGVLRAHTGHVTLSVVN
jgi:hypothetical protein